MLKHPVKEQLWWLECHIRDIFALVVRCMNTQTQAGRFKQSSRLALNKCDVCVVSRQISWQITMRPSAKDNEDIIKSNDLCSASVHKEIWSQHRLQHSPNIVFNVFVSGVALWSWNLMCWQCDKIEFQSMVYAVQKGILCRMTPANT